MIPSVAKIIIIRKRRVQATSDVVMHSRTLGTSSRVALKFKCMRQKQQARVSQMWIHPFSSRARLRFWKSTIFSRSGAFSYISINKGKLSFSSSYLQLLSIVMHAKLALSSLLGDLLPFLLLFVGKKLLCWLKCHDWMIVPDSAECEKDDGSLRNLKVQAETK